MRIRKRSSRQFISIVLMSSLLVVCAQSAQAEDNLAGVYVGEQSGPYYQSRLSSRTAVSFALTAVNSDYWVSGDLKYYLGDYANSIYITGGLSYANQQGYPSETYYRAGGGWEFATQGNVVYGFGFSTWWNQNWVQPVVRGGIYIAFYR